MNVVLHCVLVFALLGAAHGAACGLNKVCERLARLFRPRCRRTYGNAPAEFLGLQEVSLTGSQPPMELYNLTADIPGHPVGSTVSRTTLERAGYTQFPSHE